MKNASFLFFLFLFLIACQQVSNKPAEAAEDKAPRPIDEATIARLFAAAKCTGTFVLHELRANRWTIHNPQRADSTFLPASTFKIPNSIIALECQAVQSEEEMIPWDGVERSVAAWNKDHNLRSAIPVSAVWFYQELARRVGQERMQEWVNRLEYGNRDIGGGIDVFWLTGAIRISAVEQIHFLEKLYKNELAASKKTQEIVKDILVQEKTEEYTLRGKTGWANITEPDLGWYVGYLETKEEVYFFAMNMDILQAQDAAKRLQVTKAVLEEMGGFGN